MRESGNREEMIGELLEAGAIDFFSQHSSPYCPTPHSPTPQTNDMLTLNSDPCGFNAQILSGPEGSSNTGCLEQAWTPGHFFAFFSAR
jgi:hypothetical protein